MIAGLFSKRPIKSWMGMAEVPTAMRALLRLLAELEHEVWEFRRTGVLADESEDAAHQITIPFH
jgi:hypothetical protein